ncbi:MAG: hypothetical protein IPL35_15170 [Sphingobacteriales bacterium]|nr:hypothetical protein [Sphingobacteriales bacterium]
MAVRCSGKYCEPKVEQKEEINEYDYFYGHYGFGGLYTLKPFVYDQPVPYNAVKTINGFYKATEDDGFIQLQKLDVEGNIIWKNAFPFESTLQSLQSIDDYYLMINGKIKQGDQWQSITIKYNSEGEMLYWEKEHTNAAADCGYFYKLKGSPYAQVFNNGVFYYINYEYGYCDKKFGGGAAPIGTYEYIDYEKDYTILSNGTALMGVETQVAKYHNIWSTPLGILGTIGGSYTFGNYFKGNGKILYCRRSKDISNIMEIDVRNTIVDPIVIACSLTINIK